MSSSLLEYNHAIKRFVKYMYVFGWLNVNTSPSKSLASFHVHLQQILYGSCINIIEGDITFVMIMYADTQFGIETLNVVKCTQYQILYGVFLCVHSVKTDGAIKGLYLL